VLNTYLTHHTYYLGFPCVQRVTGSPSQKLFPPPLEMAAYVGGLFKVIYYYSHSLHEFCHGYFTYLIKHVFM